MLELKKVSVLVEDENKEIIKNVNLTIGENKIVAITGPNGGGKSTLAKVIMGIIKPTEGHILLDKQDITNLSIPERAKLGVTFSFQQPVRFKGLTVRDLICLAAGREMDEPQLCEYLCDVGLCARDYMDREVNASLSGGEIKRVEIAMTMARSVKRLTIFDEPEAGIDLWSFNNLIEVFQKLRGQNNGSIIIISHQERILDIADEIIILSDGQVVSQGDRTHILPDLLSNGRCAFYPEMEVAKA